MPTKRVANSTYVKAKLCLVLSCCVPKACHRPPFIEYTGKISEMIVFALLLILYQDLQGLQGWSIFWCHLKICKAFKAGASLSHDLYLLSCSFYIKVSKACKASGLHLGWLLRPPRPPTCLHGPKTSLKVMICLCCLAHSPSRAQALPTCPQTSLKVMICLCCLAHSLSTQHI